MLNLAKLDVCFIAGGLGLGGAERQLVYMVQALRTSGGTPRLLCLARGEFWESDVRALGVPVSWVGRSRARLARLRDIVAVLRQQRPQVVQSQHFYTNTYAGVAARLLGVREIGAVRNDAISEVRANGPLFGRLNLRMPRTIAANSQQGLRNAIALGTPAHRIHMLPNVVDTARFQPGGTHHGPIRLIAVGMREQKRLDRFLRVLASVRRACGGRVNAVIFGDGPLRKDLDRLARELALPPQALEFKGGVHVSAADYCDADVLVLTSDFEGTPNVILEAMACGLPVIASRVGGVPEIVQHGETGYLVDPAREDEFVESILQLIADRALRARMGGAARLYIESHHALRHLPQALSRVYEAALS